MQILNIIIFSKNFCKLIQKLSKYFLQKQSFVVDIQQPKLIINLFQRSKTSDKKLINSFVSYVETINMLMIYEVTRQIRHCALSLYPLMDLLS